MRQKSGSALTGRARSREEENLTHAVFSGASKTGGTHNFSTGASNSLQDDLQETPLHIERAGSKTDRSLNYNPDGNAERNAGENANRNAERSAGENTNRNAERSTGKNTDDRADEEVLKKTQSTESRRPGYNPETQMDNKGKTSTAWKQKILMGVAVLAIVLALAIPRILAMKFTLTVNGGSGDGDYKAGVTVTVKAEEQAGSSFTGWEAEGLELSEEELSMEELTIKMPRKAVTLTASYEVNLYTVTVNGGSGSGEYQLNDEVVIEADEPEEGYEFSKWEINSGSPAITDVSAQKLTFSMGEETVEVTSVYEQIDYQLTVNEGEGSGSYHLGDTVSISAEQTQNGMTFSGWTVDGGTLELSDLNVLNVTFTMPAEDLTLTAHYDMEMHTVKVNDGTGNGMYSVGSTVEVSADAVNSQGYAFSSWSVTSGELDTSGLDLSQPELSFTMPASDLVLQANYAEAAAVTATSASYTLTVNGGTGSGSYAAGETISVTHDAPQTGMVFVYWIASGYAGSLNSTADTLEITMPENNVILTAVFAQE
ncbi:MAG: InlB B-repeat-containing protein [Lachnospiraceae bacterium]|nr:InlB B-repeat-containing protein [Lachnospiraceae bacterium]